jgi:hypothetical protein
MEETILTQEQKDVVVSTYQTHLAKLAHAIAAGHRLTEAEVLE